MRDKKLLTPEGVRDILINEQSLKKEVEHRIESVFLRYGYSFISPPTFEYIEVFDNIGSIKLNQMYKFIDRDGSVLTLRPDVTPQIARISAANYKNSDTHRLCYTANTFRYNESYQGKLREFTQSGVELIGSDTAIADAEVIAVAINSLLAAGLSSFRIDIGHASFLPGVLEESGMDKDTCAFVLKCILEKDFVSAQKEVSKHSMPEGVKEILISPELFMGDLSLLKTCEGYVSGEKAVSALRKLSVIYEILEGYGLHRYVLFDLSLLGSLNYYTGVIFRGYTHGTGFSIIDGGRYDTLSQTFGWEKPAVGFAIRIDDLISAITKLDINLPKSDTLAAFSGSGLKTAMAVADQLRTQGVYIENSLKETTREDSIAYAKAKGLDGVIYFKNETDISIINIATGEIREAAIQDLYQASEGGETI